MASFGWTVYDSRRGGTQTIEDEGNEIDITTEFVKKAEGAGMGNWALRVKGTPRVNNPDGLKTRAIFYVAMEAMENCSHCQLDAAVMSHAQDERKFVEAVNIHMAHPQLGTAEIRMPKPTGVGEYGKHMNTIVKSIKPAKNEKLWDAKCDELSVELESTTQSSKHQFSSVFGPKSPFDTKDYTIFSQTAFSNLQGGLAYFHGTGSVERLTGKDGVSVHTEGPYELFTHVPSRSFFPRGFLWDEGFHLLLILEWDADLALEVIRSWLSLINDDGWIAREQILGAEAESKVPEEFRVQATDIANPPTLFWIVSKFVDMLQKKTKYHGHTSYYLRSRAKGKALLMELYPKLKKHYEWWRKTQAGDVETYSIPHANLDEGYRWRGRKQQSNLASGLDDYPRAEPPDDTELHVDALTWVGVMTEIMEKLALYTENEIDIVTFQTHTRNIRHNIDALHWSEDQQMYCDIRILKSQHTYVCPKGYVSLFPFMLGFIGPEHPHLNATLDLIRDPKHLWTDFGVRSLTPESSYFGKGDNYWRSPIWINVNYMLIERLLELAQRKGPVQSRCRELYNELRVNVVNTVYKSWKGTGYVWEQYDEFGKGQRTAGFTGWSALVVKIMAMPELGMGVKGAVKEGVGWAIKEAEQQGTWGGGVMLFAVLGMVFVWVTRRRFLGTVRRWRR
ncbi:Processing alpha glucosidase I [Kalmusia sp. IMI 367209]|nr:Processing alpha glucosidase I [Kalmusia sp. IMI 367209]